MAVTEDMTAVSAAASAGRRPGLRVLPVAPPRPDMPRPDTPQAAPRDATQDKLPGPVLIYLLTVMLPVGFQLGPLAMTTLRVFLMVMILPLMARMLAGRYGRVFVTDILFILHVLWGAMAIAVNNPSRVIENTGSVGIEFLGGYVLARAYIRTPEAFAALCRALVVIVLFTTPFAVFETLTGRPVIIEFLESLPGLTSVAIVNIEGRLGLERVQAVFAHPIHYGLFCSVAFSLAFVALKGRSSTLWRYVSSALIAGSGFLALSSGALLAIFLQMALIAWVTVFAGIRWRWRLLLGLFALAYVVIDLLSNRTPIGVFMSYATFSPWNAYWRSLIFEWGMKNVWGSPIFGIGLKNWVRPFFMTSGSMDNFWLVMAVRYGIPAFLLIAVGYAYGIFQILRRNFEADATLTLFRRAWVFTFLGLSFTLATVHIWTNVYSFVFFMFGAGMWLITVQPGADGGTMRQAAGPAARPIRSRAGGPTPLQPEAAAATVADHPGAEAAATDLPQPPQPAGPRYSRFPAVIPPRGRKPGPALSDPDP